MAAEIYVHTKGKSYGPYNESELKAHLRAGRLSFASWIHMGTKWELLGELTGLRHFHPEFEEAPAALPTTAALKGASLEEAVAAERGVGTTLSAEPVWFYIREKKKFGPYSAAELVGQLQRKQLEPTTFVWRPGFSTWQKMSQVSEFSRDAMKRLASDGTPIDILVKRKFPRAPYEVEVIAHDNTRAIEGKTMVVGEGGLFLATPRPQHAVGARLKLHFREGATSSFNAVGEIVSVVRGETSGYCMRFVAISEPDRKRISKFVSEKKK